MTWISAETISFDSLRNCFSLRLSQNEEIETIRIRAAKILTPSIHASGTLDTNTPKTVVTTAIQKRTLSV